MKLQAGEYVSLGKVEAVLKMSALIDNVCVYAESSKNFCVALIVPGHKPLKELAATLKVSEDFEQICSNPLVEKAVLKELAEHAKQCKLEKFEIPERITLVKEVWSPTTGLITAAFKIKRKDIQDKYKADIVRMYAK